MMMIIIKNKKIKNRKNKKINLNISYNQIAKKTLINFPINIYISLAQYYILSYARLKHLYKFNKII